jgi:tetratricopeptide (TPR) repeat protein
MFSRRVFLRVLPLAVLLVCQLGAGSLGAAAATPPAGDQVSWVSLNVGPAQSQRPTDTLDFHATVNFQVSSVAAARLFLFVFENGTSSSSIHSAPVDVSAGTGQQTLTMTYSPSANARSLTLFAGMFTGTQSLLAWTATDPVPLPEWQAKAAYVAAMEASQTGDYPTSIADLTTAIGLEPKTANFYYWRADANSHVGEYDAALSDYSKALALAPNDRASRLGRGVAYLWKGDNQQAIADLTKVVGASGPPDELTAWAYRALGVAYSSAGQPAQAIADYQQYLTLVPDASDHDQVVSWINQLQANG